ncbi:MAG TPA: NAD(P)H-hydrate epimerase, partial [Armatimonadota bacterium]|nr:NAD(P)H-hydrate epimerase [Armatimonadota bacterium]
MRIATAAQMRELDRRATAEFGVPSIILMENAGLRTFDFVYDVLMEVGGYRVGIVCGRGNNGGDGFVVTRHLHEVGAEVIVFLAGNAEDIKGDARVNYEIILKTGITINPITDAESLRLALSQCDIIVDALFGTGIKGEITGLPGEVIDAINDSGRPIVA